MTVLLDNSKLFKLTVHEAELPGTGSIPVFGTQGTAVSRSTYRS